jgi:hypothetical protein
LGYEAPLRGSGVPSEQKADQEARKRHGVGRMSRQGRRWRASEDPLWVWGCGGPTIGCLVVLVFVTTVLISVMFGDGLVEGMVYGLVVLGGIAGLMYAAIKHYS